MVRITINKRDKMKKFNTFWLGFYLCDLINKLIGISPKCFIKFYLDLYELAKKIRDRSI